MIMTKKKLLILALLLIIICAAVLIACGRTYTLSYPAPADADTVRVRIENEDAGVRLAQSGVEDGSAVFRFTALKRGKTDVAVYYGEEPYLYFRLYTHLFGVITYESAFGDSTGDIVIPIALLLYLAALLLYLIQRYRADVRRNMYQYRNVMAVGLVVFLCFFALYLLWQSFNYHGVIDSVDDFLGVIHLFSVVVLPVAFVLSLLMIVSNLNLMRREGRSWRNMLGIFLSVGLCLLTLLPTALGEYLQWSANPIMDVHNERSAGLYIETFTEGVISMLVSYLECILIGTIAFGIKAARQLPAFDKDYILILGCQIGDDGTLPPLLKSRADRALEFARMQKEKTGKTPIFVPSGGKGADEIMAEAEAITAYLLETGVPDGSILPETTSVNTYENIRNSMKLIRKHAKTADPKVAFSTTNYHVFRAGLIAAEQNERLEGIGSPTKRYFWLNAFVREFIATLISERNKHILIVSALVLLILSAVIVKYLSVIL